MGSFLGKISVEMPAHTVVHQADDYEIWRYPSSEAATVRASDLSPQNPPVDEHFTNQAFRALARYIGVFSEAENKKRDGKMERIAMTAPVVMSENGESIAITTPVPMGEGGQTRDCIMKFLLPSKYRTIEDAPVPTNPAVKLEMAVGGRCEAVLTYAGAARFSIAREKAAELLKMLERDGIEPKGSYTVHGYNPPFTLPMFKRTEIHIPVNAASYE